MIDIPAIEQLLPHRPPMLLLDRLLSADELNAVAEIRITPASTFFISSDGVEGVPAWVGIEYMAQTIAALAGWRALRKGLPVPTGYLLGTRHYACTLAHFRSGQTLTIEVSEQMFDDNGLGAYNCRILGDAETGSRADHGAGHAADPTADTRIDTTVNSFIDTATELASARLTVFEKPQT